MIVSLVNDGPYTILVDTDGWNRLGGEQRGISEAAAAVPAAVDVATDMRLPDYHTHTARCGHARGTPAEYVKAARAAGLLAIGVADHLPLLPEPDPELSMEACELGDYVGEVLELKAAFPGFVLLGVEADYRPGTVSEVRSLLESQPFDYVIGSVHHLGDWGFDDPRQMEGYSSRDDRRRMGRLLRTGGRGGRDPASSPSWDTSIWSRSSATGLRTSSTPSSTG